MNGITQKDSMYHPIYTWALMSIKLLDKTDIYGNTINKLYLDDTINFSGVDMKPSDFYSWNSVSEANGKFIVTGLWQESTTQFDIFSFCIDTLKNPLWLTFHNLYPLSDVKASTYSKVFSNGNILVAGQHQSNFSPTGTDIFASMLDINGNQIWSKRYYINEFQVPWYSTELSDGSLLLCGRNNNSAMFFKVNPINGDSLQMHTSLTIPFADNSKLDVKYLEERSNHTYLSMVYDAVNQGYICTLDTNFNLLSAYATNAYYDNFFRVNDNEFVGYKENSPVSVYAFDEFGTEKWNLQLTNPEYVNFTPDGNGGLMGAGNVEDNNGNSDFYLVRIDSVGYPAPPICNTPPSIQSVTADVVGVNKSVNLGAEAVEYLKYSDVIGYNWYFEDGIQKFGQYLNYNFDESVYPTSFWCMLVVTDAIGCTDTMTIDAYTGDVIFPNPDWPPLGIEEVKNNSASIIKPTIYPNPFSNEIRIKLNNSKIESYSISIYDVLGKIIHSSIEMNNETTINLKTYPKGTYIIKIATSNFMYSEKVVKY